MRIPFIKQHDAMDCGPSCLAMIARYHGKQFNTEQLRKECLPGKGGISLLSISRTAERIDFMDINIKLIKRIKSKFYGCNKLQKIIFFHRYQE